MFDEGFKILSCDFFNTLAATLTEGKEHTIRREGTQERPRFMVQTPLVAHGAVKVVRIPKLHTQEFLEDTFDKCLFAGFFVVAHV
jgi:hypothetical protein